MLAQSDLNELLPNLRPRYVYGIQSGQFIKIGVAVSIGKRLDKMRLSNPHKLTVVYSRKVLAAFHCEKKMHEILKDRALGREWFDVTIEEVRAAGSLGVAYAKQVYLSQAAKFYIGAPVTHALEDVARSAHKMGLT